MIFVDTGAWIALTDISDQHHGAAASIYAGLKARRARFVTTDYVIDETLTRLRYDTDHATAVRFLDIIEQSSRSGAVHVVSVTEGVMAEAKRLFRRYDTAVLSFTDCTSFVICRELQIHEAFGFDSHFTMMGITLIAAR